MKFFYIWLTSLFDLICDLPITDVLKMYLSTKNEVSRSRLSKVRTRTGQTDRQTRVCGLQNVFFEVLIDVCVCRWCLAGCWRSKHLLGMILHRTPTVICPKLDHSPVNRHSTSSPSLGYNKSALLKAWSHLRNFGECQRYVVLHFLGWGIMPS